MSYNTIKEDKMKTCKSFKNLIKMGDFFNSYQMLRYQKETEYRTLTGGIISMAIITTIIIAFASMILDTINRNIIDFTLVSEREIDPAYTSILIEQGSTFMFGVEVWGYNLSSDSRLFDVTFTQIESNFGQDYVNTVYPLQICTEEHWQVLKDQGDWSKLNISNWLCPTPQTVIELQGKYSSEFYHQFSVTLHPCSNDTDPLRPCAPREQLDSFFLANGQWNYFTFYYINSVVNPDQPEYKKYYLQDRMWIIFGPKLGAELDMYLGEVEITTDNSIWPLSDSTIQKLYNIHYSPVLYPYSIEPDSAYAAFFVMKDPVKKTYSRTVQKIFVVFSFMGGLIGAVMAALFIVNSYTGFAFEVALGVDLFKPAGCSTHRELKLGSQKSVTLFHYFQFLAYNLLSLVGIKPPWPSVQYREECREEILQQLDIIGLIKRVIFLQYAISYLLQDFHISQMQLKRPVSPAQVRALRQKIQAREQSSLEEQIISEDIQFLKQPMNTTKNQSTQTRQPSLNTSKKPTTVFQNICNADSFRISSSDLVRESEQLEKDDAIGRTDSYSEKKQRRRSNNWKKIKQSAEKGNLVSRKLLVVLSKVREESDGLIQENNSFTKLRDQRAKESDDAKKTSIAIKQ